MKRIFVFVIVFIMLFAFNSTVSATEKRTENSDVGLQVDVKAKACVLMDCNTGTVLAAKNENELLYPASVTKVMSLLLVCEALEQGKLTMDMEITCSETAAAKGGSQIWLEPGEVMTVNDLLKATVVYSANDACCLLAETIAGDEMSFCVKMNEKAKSLGMNNTNFDNCTGLDDDTDTHKTTAYDIALMSRELLKYEVIQDFSTIRMDSLRNGETQLVNTNKLIRNYPGATGLKTGTTSKAGCCISASAERDGLHLIAVVLGAENSKDRFAGAKNLLDWGFANFEVYKPDASGSYSESLQIIGGVKDSLELTHSEISDLLVSRGSTASIKTEVNLPENINAPVQKGQKIGEIVFDCDGKTLGRCDIVAAEDVEEMTFINALRALLSAFLK